MEEITVKLPDTSKLKNKFITLCKENIHRDGINDILEWLDNAGFYNDPASTIYHGNYPGGLVEHSINVYEQLIRLSQIYCEENEFTNETLAIVSLFHDVCKVNFYKPCIKNVKTDKGWVQKQVYEINEAVPLGHGEKSCLIISSYMKLMLPELLAIRWHMGEYDSAVKGGDRGYNKACEKSKLVTLLHVADLLSANLLEKTTV